MSNRFMENLDNLYLNDKLLILKEVRLKNSYINCYVLTKKKKTGRKTQWIARQQ